LGDFENQVFRTPTGKVELYSERMAAHGLDPLPGFVAPAADASDDDEFPLLLLTGAREKTYHHSRFRDQAWARKVSPDPWLKIHPATAAALGTTEDDWVAVEVANGSGRCRFRARLTEDVEENVVSTGMGWWLPEAEGPEHGALDVNINGAMSYGPPYDPAAGSANTRGLRCRVTRLANETAAAAE
jgi:anaerobic selenocysteine-containing dehydrogenase